MPDGALRGGGRVGEAAARPVHGGEQAEGPCQGAVVAHRLKLGNLLFHEVHNVLLHGVGVGRVAQVEAGEVCRPGGSDVAGRKRQVRCLG
jgi:hypothetical protein